MIVRVFRASVPTEFHEEFEEKVLSVSVPLLKSQRGMVSVSVGRPVPEASSEYLLLSTWEDVRSIKDFVGEDWNQGHIPSGMEKYIEESWVTHHETFE